MRLLSEILGMVKCLFYRLEESKAHLVHQALLVQEGNQALQGVQGNQVMAAKDNQDQKGHQGHQDIRLLESQACQVCQENQVTEDFQGKKEIWDLLVSQGQEGYQEPMESLVQQEFLLLANKDNQGHKGKEVFLEKKAQWVHQVLREQQDIMEHQVQEAHLEYLVQEVLLAHQVSQDSLAVKENMGHQDYLVQLVSHQGA
uniref:Uncharacterized protein n=1 Tax=Sphaerodactylus townsendi TaxID=933632 RepID=A0ACB8GCX3_9SAUR